MWSLFQWKYSENIQTSCLVTWLSLMYTEALLGRPLLYNRFILIEIAMKVRCDLPWIRYCGAWPWHWEHCGLGPYEYQWAAMKRDTLTKTTIENKTGHTSTFSSFFSVLVAARSSALTPCCRFLSFCISFRSCTTLLKQEQGMNESILCWTMRK